MPPLPGAGVSRKPAVPVSLRRLALAILLATVAVAPLWHVHVIDERMPAAHNDLVGRWIGTQEALRGRDPYSAETTRDIQRFYYGRALVPADDMDPQGFAYPAQLIVLLSPFAQASWQTGCLGFLLVITPILGWSIWACVRFIHPSIPARNAALAVFFSLFSWPVIWGLRLCQPTFLIAVFIFFGLFQLSRNRPVSAGILLALGTIKPPLVLPLLLWLVLWAVLHQSWKLIVSFAVALSLLLLATENMVPGWFSHWLAYLHQYGPHTVLPLEAIFGHWLGLAASALLAGWSAYLLWKLRSAPPASLEFGLAASLALSVAVSVTLFKLPVIYNHVLAIPGCLLLVFSKPVSYPAALARRIALALLVAGFVLVDVAILGETLFGASDFWDGVPCRSFLLPVAVTVALAFHAQLELRARRAAGIVALPVPVEVA